MAAVEIAERSNDVAASVAAAVIALMWEQPFARYAGVELDEMRRGVATRKQLHGNGMLLRGQFVRLEERRRAQDPGAPTPIDVLVAQIAGDVRCYRYSDAWAKDVVDGWLVTVATEIQQRQGLDLVEAAHLVHAVLAAELGSGVA